MCFLLIAGVGGIVVILMLLFRATGPEPEDHQSRAQLESAATFGRSELVNRPSIERIIGFYATTGHW